MNYACQAAIGAVSGLRSFTGAAIISEAAHQKVINLKRTPLAWLGNDLSARTAAALAAGELIADKLPLMSKRTTASSLLVRAAAGAVCGVAVAGRSKRKETVISGLVAGAAAVAAAYLGYQYRKHVNLPAVVAALIEDVVAVGVGTAVVTQFCD